MQHKTTELTNIINKRLIYSYPPNLLLELLSISYDTVKLPVVLLSCISAINNMLSEITIDIVFCEKVIF